MHAFDIPRLHRVGGGAVRRFMVKMNQFELQV